MNVSKLAIFSLFFFLVCFPKGGIRIGAIPLTWGYLLLGFWGAVGFWKCLSRRTIPLSSGIVLAALLPLQVILIAKLFVCGWKDSGTAVSLFASFVILPYIFFLSFPSFSSMDVDFFKKLIKRSLLFVAIFGIFLFIYKCLTSRFIEIPYLTVNVDDVGQLEGKHIDRGFIFKLISTYNNGNLYGICILMLLPLFSLFEKRYLPNLLVKLSLFLTLSRTVWAGLIVFEILEITIFKLMKRSFLRLLTDFALVGLFVYLFYLFGFNFEFLMDADLGGRRAQFSISPVFFPKEPLEVIGEITYLGFLREFGVIGLLFFLIALMTPLFIPKQGELGKAAFFGMILYLFLSFSDGAIELIPVMAFYWGLVSMSLMRYTPCNENAGH